MYNEIELGVLVGKTVIEILNTGDELIFICEDGKKYKLYHSQDCCESVYIEDINGDLQDLVGSPILLSDCVSNPEFEQAYEDKYNKTNEYGYRTDDEGSWYPDSHTWSFYKFATIKGYVDVKWFGTSNGYYSERVSFEEVGGDDE